MIKAARPPKPKTSFRLPVGEEMKSSLRNFSFQAVVMFKYIGSGGNEFRLNFILNINYLI